MAYSPLADAGRLRNNLVNHPVVQDIANNHHIQPYQLLLAWCIHSGDVLAIPKASTEGHIKQNAAVDQVELTQEDLSRLDQAFPKPSRKVPLDVN
jgi:diketogulonate reductase-like aldo/keto reductase